METGRVYYNAGNAMNAEMSFLAALEQRPSSYAPYYYLGLIYYEENSFDLAEEFYKVSLENGADAALVNYALGINAASAGRNADARIWLENAAELDPGRYETRVGELLQRLSLD